LLRDLLRALGAIGLAVTATLVVPGVAQAAPVPEYEAQVKAYLKTYPELTRAEAENRVNGQPARAALLERLTTQHATSFGGSWFDARTGVQHLNVVGSATSFTASAADAGLRVAVHRVKYALDDLEARADRIRNERTTAGAGRLGVGIDPVRNRVVVSVTSSAAARAALGSAASDPAVLTEIGTALTVDPDACHSRFNCSAPLRSGVALRRDGVNTCSVGFTVRGGDGVRWAVTAGHCMGVDDGRIWSHNTVDIGPIGDAWNSENIDVSRIRMTRAPWADASGGWLYNEGNPDSPTALNAAITRNAQVQAGDSVCLQGFNTNARHACGVILEAFDDDFRGMTRVDFDACGGDSGGGWYSPNGGNRTAIGIHSSSTGGSCHSQDGVSWFSTIPTLNAFWDRHSATTIRVETR
jgi:streptogrisin C